MQQLWVEIRTAKKGQKTRTQKETEILTRNLRLNLTWRLEMTTMQDRAMMTMTMTTTTRMTKVRRKTKMMTTMLFRQESC
jgi:hypothetical protein